MNDLFKSKRFWAAVASLAVVLLKDVMKFPLSETQLTEILMVVSAWIVGDSLRSTVPPNIEVDDETLAIVADSVAERLKGGKQS
jgi:hypothetical protein